MNRSKSLFSKIIAPVAALGLSLGVVAGAGAGLTANAAQFQETYESGWYMVGNGVGDLKDCSWQAYLADWRLTGTTEDEENYFGVWKTPELLLYQGDQFKLLYNNGEWEVPDDSKWTPEVCAQFENVKQDETAEEKDFSDGGLGNIYVEESDYYTFTLTVSEDAETGEAALVITYTREHAVVPPIVLYDMYVVGTIASLETVWPEQEGFDLGKCPKMAITGTTDEGVNIWTATAVLGLDDEFKLYNTITGTYYPGGFDNNLTVTVAGTYTITWVQGSQDVTLTLQTPVEG